MEGYQEVLCHIANMCAEYFEKERYVTPNEKFRLLRVMPYIIFLMDNADAKKSVLKVKNLRPDRFAKIFKVTHRKRQTQQTQSTKKQKQIKPNQSKPIQFNPIQSNPIQSNPIQLSNQSIIDLTIIYVFGLLLHTCV